MPAPPDTEERSAVATQRVLRRRDAPYYTLILACLLVSRLAIALAGVRFDASTLNTFYQIVDPHLLKTRLLESLFHLHSQPPLFNLVLGVTLKVFPQHYVGAFHAEYLLLGIVGSFATYFLFVRLGLSRRTALLLAVLLAVSPPVLLYENWLFYEYPTMVLLVLSAIALHRFLSVRSFWSGLVYFGLLATIVYTRSSFHLLWMIVAICLVLAAMRGSRGVVLGACALPLLAVSLLYVKNYVVFGVAGASSWQGMNLADIVQEAPISRDEKLRLIREGDISRIILVEVFSAPEAYRGIVAFPKKRGIPVLDEPRRSTGAVNYNDLVYVNVSRKYLHDSLRLIWVHPYAYLRRVGKAMIEVFFLPASRHFDVAANRAKLGPYERLFDAAVFWRTPLLFGMGLAILAAYVTVWIYGLALVVRWLRKRASPTPTLVSMVWMWFTVIWVTVSIALTQNYENERIRFEIDPFVVALVAVAVRACYRTAVRTRTSRAAERRALPLGSRE